MSKEPTVRPSLHHIRWSQADHDTGLLLDYLRQYLKKHGIKIKAIVVVTRGGLVPGALVAYAQGISWIDTVCMKSYDGAVQREIQFMKDLHPDTVALGGEGGKYLLFVDDLADGGATLRAVRERYPKATIIAPYAKSKPEGLQVLDAWAVQIPGTTWYDFPWSRRENKVKELRSNTKKK